LRLAISVFFDTLSLTIQQRLHSDGCGFFC
jgi:hypothetical protein